MDKKTIKAMTHEQLISEYQRNIRMQDNLWNKAEKADDLEDSESYLAQYLSYKAQAKSLEIELSYRGIII